MVKTAIPEKETEKEINVKDFITHQFRKEISEIKILIIDLEEILYKILKTPTVISKNTKENVEKTLETIRGDLKDLEKITLNQDILNLKAYVKSLITEISSLEKLFDKIPKQNKDQQEQIEGLIGKIRQILTQMKILLK